MTLEPVSLFLSVFSISSVSGLAALLRSGKEISVRSTMSAMLNSGLFGLGIAFVWYKYYDGGDSPWFLMGISLLAGLGGTSLIDFALQLAKRVMASYVSQRTADDGGTWPPRKMSRPRDSDVCPPPNTAPAEPK